jgi:hypothetical protein
VQRTLALRELCGATLAEAHAPRRAAATLGLELLTYDGLELLRYDGHVHLILPPEHLQLGFQISLDRAVAVEMVGRQVEQHRGLGCKRERVFELEGGRLAHHYDALLYRADEPAERRSDVAGDGGGQARLPVNVTDELHRRGLAVRASYGDELVRKHPPGELELADHTHSQ